MFCQSCGNETPDQGLFCLTCGSRVNKECPNCAEIVKIKAKICRFCGYTFIVEEIIEEKQRVKEVPILDQQKPKSEPEKVRNATRQKEEQGHIKAYKRFLDETKLETVTELRNRNGEIIFVVGKNEETLRKFECPWCLQEYEVSASGKNAFFICIKCKKTVFITYDQTE